MRPKKAKELIPEVASTLDLSEEVVKDITQFYWQEIRRSLSSLSHQRVHLSNLGDFIIKDWKIEDKIKRIEAFETSNKLKGMSLLNARFRTAEQLFELRNLKDIMKKEKQREEFIKMHKRNLYETKGKHHTDMEGEGSDH